VFNNRSSSNTRCSNLGHNYHSSAPNSCSNSNTRNNHSNSGRS
jgi:hypothetical protein